MVGDVRAESAADKGVYGFVGEWRGWFGLEGFFDNGEEEGSGERFVYCGEKGERRGRQAEKGCLRVKEESVLG
jgi:hypothetical protein